MYPKLVVARLERKLTQSQLAEKIGVCKQSYHLKEKRKQDFTVSEARTLSKFFNKSLDDLFGE